MKSAIPIVLLLAFHAAACHSLELRPVVPATNPVASGSFRAGAALVDVTPPPGYSTFGHGPNGLEAHGHRGRLHCRVVYLEDARGEGVALVPCDFAAMSVALHRAVAERTAAGIGLGMDRIVLSGTHTHGGPGNYFAAYNYTRPLTSEPRGFDRGLLRVLADRIARGIESAHQGARPARIAWYTGRINGNGGDQRSIGVNRSLDAHCRNDVPMPGEATTCRDPEPNANAEVEGRLDLLRVDADDAEGTPIALFASFPVHGTVVPHSNTFYEADLWGFAARFLEARLGRPDRPFVAALANGAEGDVRPNYEEQGWDEARRLGELLGARIAAVYERPPVWENEPRIAIAYRDVKLRDAVAPNDSHVTLCGRPELGRVAPGGSEEGRTTGLSHNVSRPEGTTDEGRNSCHAPAVRMPLARRASHYFPDVAPLTVVGIGSATLLAYPWEMTTTAGMELRNRIHAVGEADSPVVLVGLASEYLQYLTTAKEYRAQHYEGASVLFGENTLEVVTQHFEALVIAMRRSRDGGPRTVDAQGIEISRTNPRELVSFDVSPSATTLDVDGCHAMDFEGHDAFVVAFRAGPPASVVREATVIARVEHRDATGAYVPLTTSEGVPIDDAHEDVLFEHLGRNRRERDRYRVIWVPREGTPAGDYRIVVASCAGGFVPGPSFTFRGRP